MALSLTGDRQAGKIVSVAQFRPEKDHSLQVRDGLLGQMWGCACAPFLTIECGCKTLHRYCFECCWQAIR